MSYCHRCGKLLKGVENFCAECGAKIKEAVEDIEEKTKEIIKKSHKGLGIFILFLIIAGYIALDLWAATQLRPEISLGSIGMTISNLKGESGLTSASASTKLRINNPTFVPIFLFPINYKVAYGSTEIAEGNTGLVFIAPYSSNDIPANIELSYLGTGKAVLEGIWNAFSGNKENLRMDFYELGIKIVSIEG